MTAAPDASSLQHLSDIAARRFPLVARAQVIGRPLQVRTDQIRARADQAAAGGPDMLVRACEALNLAALTASDCGLPDLARAWCWDQFDLLHQARPHPLDTAKLTLQPIINLARLRIRDGDGEAAWRLLEDLFSAIRTRADTELDGRPVSFHDFTRSDELGELCQWLWEVLLNDGLRALARASRWQQAHAQAEQLRGIGTRLGDGRQIAILATCLTGRSDKALNLLSGSHITEPWEEAVVSCLTVLCLRSEGTTATAQARQLINRYLAFSREEVPELAAFTTRLGLAVLDLLDEPDARTAVHDRLVGLAVSPGGSYAARDVLAHPICAANLDEGQNAALDAVVRGSGLGRGRLPSEVFECVAVSMAALTSSSN
ncbi:hypothetical protein [Acrocarpospora catenulata]|uniref:hypothetical protein n=1 Tax=Acrocarpospora catenulata TaxID=2836182 RepID=UPI001BDB19CA|nr:hypothetical protein [Acrocarpospora catenulata]